MKDWYEESPFSVTTLEKAILLEDVNFDMSDEDDIIGKFNIPIITPTMKAGVAVENNRDIPRVKVQSNTTLDTGDYITTNYIMLIIPKFLLIDFITSRIISNNVLVEKGRIPEGTEFIVGFLGQEIDHVRLIGINKEI